MKGVTVRFELFQMFREMLYGLGVIRPELQVITNSLGWLRQVRSLDRVIDITTNTATSYVLSFYNIGDVLSLSTNGLYTFTNSPFQTVLIQLVNGDTNHLQVMDSSDPAPTDYYWTNGDWSMVSGNGIRTETLTTTTNGTTATKLRTIQNAQGGIDYQTTEIWQNFSFGQRLLQKTIGSGPMAQTNTYTYTAGGLLQQANNSDGSWDIYTYDSMGRQVGHYSPFLNSPPTTNVSQCRFTASTYTNSVVAGSGDVAALEPYTPRMVVNYALGQEISRSYTVIKSGERDEYQCVNPGAAWNDYSNLVTVTYYLTDALNLGKPSKIVRPDGTMQLFAYDTAVNAPVQGAGASGFNMIYNKTTVWSGAPDYTMTSIVDGTMEETWTDPMQNTVLHRVTDIASQVIVEQEKYFYDDRGHLINTVYLNRTSTQQTYDCCNLQSSTAPDGTVTSYGYDALKRQYLTTVNGITTSNIYNANGDILGTVRYGTDGSAITNSLSSYNDGGQLISSTDGLGNATTYSNYFDGSGQLIKVTTYPDTTTRIETYAIDGSLLKVTGTAVLPVRYAYGVETDGGVQRFYKQEIKLDANGNDTSEWTKTYTDMLGRAYKTVYAIRLGDQWLERFQPRVHDSNFRGRTAIVEHDVQQWCHGDQFIADRLRSSQRLYLRHHHCPRRLLQHLRQPVWTPDLCRSIRRQRQSTHGCRLCLRRAGPAKRRDRRPQRHHDQLLQLRRSGYRHAHTFAWWERRARRN